MATKKENANVEDVAMNTETEAVTAETETLGAEKTSAQNPNDLVEVYLFTDGEKYKDDVFVAVNGVGMIVPRGKRKRSYDRTSQECAYLHNRYCKSP